MDPIADMLTRIRNAQAVGEKQVRFPASKRKAAILAILKEEGYIEDYSVIPQGAKSAIDVALKYFQGAPVIAKLQRVSRPGLRIYKGAEQMPIVLAGLGIAIVTTPKGIMTAKNARAQNVGGEVLCIAE